MAQFEGGEAQVPEYFRGLGVELPCLAQFLRLAQGLAGAGHQHPRRHSEVTRKKGSHGNGARGGHQDDRPGDLQQAGPPMDPVGIGGLAQQQQDAAVPVQDVDDHRSDQQDQEREVGIGKGRGVD